MQIYNEDKADWFIIKPQGAFVVRSLLEIRNQFEQHIKTGNHSVALDLSATTYLDSSAINLIVNFNNTIKNVGGKFVVFGAGKDIQGIFAIVNLSASVDIRDKLLN